MRVHEAADCGDLPALQAALAEMQHPEAEVDQLVTWGGGLPLAPFHRAAAAGRETCLKASAASILPPRAAPKLPPCSPEAALTFQRRLPAACRSSCWRAPTAIYSTARGAPLSITRRPMVPRNVWK